MKAKTAILILCAATLLNACSSDKKTTEGKAASDSLKTEPPSSEERPKQAKEEDKSTTLPAPDATPLTLIPHQIALANDTFNLNIPEGFNIKVAYSGLKRIRFMDRDPDGRVFLTDMFNLADNKKGKVYILEGFNDSTGTFSTIHTYLDNLRNPNNLAFYNDEKGRQWLYITQTDKLIRYPLETGEISPSGEAQVLDTYPDYGLSYRYGGWHLTRTVQFGTNGKMYIAVGSSCNACVEKEESRACIIEMDPDGKNRRVFAKGIRNAVGLEFAGGGLYSTNMAADHLGDDKPEDALYKIRENDNFGWPFFYQYKSEILSDPKFDTIKSKPVTRESVPLAYAPLGGHAAVLGLEYFGNDTHKDHALANYFLVALHGSYTPRIGRGYSIQRVRQGAKPEDFITGFLENGNVHGRPCGILAMGEDKFLFTDDKFGVLYYVYKEK